MNALFKVVTHQIGLKIASVLIAFVLWGVVIQSRTVEITKEVPLEVVTSDDVVPSNEIPEKISFRISGPKAFLRAILNRREDPIRVNLTGNKPGLVTYRFYPDDIRLPLGVKVQAVNPTAALVKLEAVKKKDVPVRVELRGIPPEGYRLVSAHMRPEVVKLKGPESKIEAISEILTLPIDLSQAKQSFEREVGLDLERTGLRAEGALPRIHVEIEALAANFKIKNVDIRVLTPYGYRLEEKSVTVLVHASAKDMKTLDKSQVFAIVDLRQEPKGKYLRPIKVTVPAHIGVVKVIPDQVNVTTY